MKASYRAKPVVITAEQFDPSGEHRLRLPFGVSGIHSPGADNWAYDGCVFYIDTLEGQMNVLPTNWIVTGTRGELYPIRDDSFREKYEAVEVPV